MLCLTKNSATQMSEWLLRGGFGVFLLFNGIGKFTMGMANFTGFVIPSFEETFLPMFLVTAVAYAIPFLEVGLGIWLLSGYKRDWALVGTGKLLVLLMFGHLIKGELSSVNSLFIYIFIVAYTLSLPKLNMCCKEK